MSELVEEFARALIRQVRDEAIDAAERQFTNRTAKGDRWRRLATELAPRDLVIELIPDVVDEAISALLWAIDDGRLALWFKPAGGQAEDLRVAGEGEMLGWYADESEWLTRYSGQRFHPYLAEIMKGPVPDPPGGLGGHKREEVDG